MNVPILQKGNFTNMGFDGPSMIRVASLFSAVLKLCYHDDDSDSDDDDTSNDIIDNEEAAGSDIIHSLPLQQQQQQQRPLQQQQQHFVEHIEAIHQNSLTFTYSAVIRPRFSRCGRFITDITNNGFDRVTVTKVNYSDCYEPWSLSDNDATPHTFELKGGLYNHFLNLHIALYCVL